VTNAACENVGPLRRHKNKPKSVAAFLMLSVSLSYQAVERKRELVEWMLGTLII
jgi:hypothetical protein